MNFVTNITKTPESVRGSLYAGYTGSALGEIFSNVTFCEDGV